MHVGLVILTFCTNNVTPHLVGGRLVPDAARAEHVL